MSWKDKMRQASFRGVPFFVEAASVETGRKIQLHEYPMRDRAYAEDLGKATPIYQLTAFVIGADCFEQRDALLDALEQEGTGTLVHPWLGRLSVKAGACKHSYHREDGGYFRFELRFYPGEELDKPTAEVSTVSAILENSKTFAESAKERFVNAIKGANIAGVNVDTLVSSVQTTITSVTREIAAISELADDVSGFVSMALNDPLGLADKFLGGSVLGLRGSISHGLSALSSFSKIISSSGHKNSGGTETVAVASAIVGLARDAMIIRSAHTAAEMPAEEAPKPIATPPAVDIQARAEIERADVPVADDVIEARDQLSEALWVASENVDYAHFLCTQNLRQAIATHLTAVAEAGVNLKRVELLEPMPALVIAWNELQDGTRSGEVVQRNAVSHPGFVPMGTISIADK